MNTVKEEMGFPAFVNMTEEPIRQRCFGPKVLTLFFVLNLFRTLASNAGKICEILLGWVESPH